MGRTMAMIECNGCGESFEKAQSEINRNTRHFCSKKCYGKSMKAGKNVSCKVCDKTFYAQKFTLENGHGKYCSTACFGIGNNKSLENHPSWKGGKRTNIHGYVLTNRPDNHRAWKEGYVFEHIVIAEEVLGRELNDRECIHHINENKGDNRAENLFIFKTTGEHSAYHNRVAKEQVKEITKSNLKTYDESPNKSYHGTTHITGNCDHCGKEFSKPYYEYNKREIHFCDRICWAKYREQDRRVAFCL